ncbi:unnamed protein product, partial [Phyllotreta striolata]
MYFIKCILIFFALITISNAGPVKGDALASFRRGKRDHGHGVTGPVHTFVKTDKHANFKWGVRHHVGHHYAGRK